MEELENKQPKKKNINKAIYDVEYQKRKYATDDNFKNMKKRISSEYYKNNKQKILDNARTRYMNEKKIKCEKKVNNEKKATPDNKTIFIIQFTI